jgi:hypothetical protein
MWGHVKLTYEAPNHTALNRTIWSQTKACINKLSCEICTLLGNYTAKSGNFLPTFRDFGRTYRPHLQMSRNPREKGAWLKLTDTTFFFGGGGGGVLSILSFLKHDFWKLALFLFWGKKAPNLTNPLDQAYLSNGHHRNSNLRHPLENRSSPRAVTGLAIKKQKISSIPVITSAKASPLVA